MKTHKAQIVLRPDVLVRRLFKLERCGKYAEGLAELSDLWPRFDSHPDVASFEPHDAAAVVLRCGSLIGFHGHSTQLEGAQERSKDLLMDARERFLDLGDIEAAAECENYLALAYWRKGELNEAQTWLDESLSRSVEVDQNAMFSAIIQCLINIPAKKFETNLTILRSVETQILGRADDCLKGDFYNHCGLALKNLGRKAEALQNYELSKHFHERSRHKVYLGTVENNLAFLYKEFQHFHKAHEAIDNATKLFKQLKDKTREGFCLDSKACLYLAEKKYARALEVIDRALLVLKKTENADYLAQTLLTKAKILVYMDKFTSAVVSLIEGVNLIKAQAGETAALALIEEFETTLKSKDLPAEATAESGEFELIIPEPIAGFSDYRGIWINNTLLEGVGLKKGSLAVVAKSQIARGDLIALMETETKMVNCGFYDAEFGIVCLERGDDEPLLFGENDVRILGRIVGVCKSGKTEDGKMVVEALTV